MTSVARAPELSIRDDWTYPGIAWASALALSAARVQRLQIEALFAWQAAAVAINGELWDEWRCRFAGGVPIDG